MKNIVVISLSCLLLAWCSITSQSETTNNKPSSRVEFGRTYNSWVLAIVYSDQERLFGRIEFPDQRDVIVEHARTNNQIVQQDKFSSFGGLYGSVALSGTTLHYDNVFELRDLRSGSKRRYDRDYRRIGQHYREEFEFVDGSQRMSINSFMKTIMSSEQDSPYVIVSLDDFCTRHGDRFTSIERQTFEQLWSGWVYMLNWDNGGEYWKYSTACFEHEDRRFEIVWMMDQYKDDIMDVLALQ